MSSKRGSKRTAARKEVSDGEDENPVPIPRSSKRQQMAGDLKEAEEQRESEPEDANGESDGPKRKQSAKSDPKPPRKAAKTEGKMNKTDSDFGAMDFSSRSETKDGKAWNMKISSWNVSGLRALIKKNGLDFLKHEDPDVFCMQETKCSTQKLPPEAIVDGYHKYWCAADKEGYSGTSVFSKAKPLSVAYGLGAKEHDSEGRLVTVEYDKFYLVNVYVPNSGRGLVTLPKRMKWDEALRAHLQKLEAKKPVILCGDLNVAHEEIDLANPKTNTKNAGFTREERDGMTALLAEGYVDSFRHLYPDRAGAYTFWAYFGNARAKNVGWRLDYFVVSEKLLGNLCDSVIRSDVYGSDHCPITLLLNV